jgi:hypothetical protein
MPDHPAEVGPANPSPSSAAKKVDSAVNGGAATMAARIRTSLDWRMLLSFDIRITWVFEALAVGGHSTSATVESMTVYDPDKTWKRVAGSRDRREVSAEAH